MDSDASYKISDEANLDVEKEVDGLKCSKRKRARVPKRVLKAEREKLKREQLNDHFCKLADILDLCEANNGKASILNETIQLVKDMISHIQCLRRENAALLSESNYMIVERNELKDEKLALKTQIKELEDKLEQSKPNLNVTPLECWRPQPQFSTQYAGSDPPSIGPTLPNRTVMAPLYIIPVGTDPQAFSKSDLALTSQVSKPHARYPMPTDLWPQKLLGMQPNTS